jgi:hypothetical protein
MIILISVVWLTIGSLLLVKGAPLLLPRNGDALTRMDSVVRVLIIAGYAGTLAVAYYTTGIHAASLLDDVILVTGFALLFVGFFVLGRAILINTRREWANSTTPLPRWKRFLIMLRGSVFWLYTGVYLIICFCRLSSTSWPTYALAGGVRGMRLLGDACAVMVLLIFPTMIADIKGN